MKQRTNTYRNHFSRSYENRSILPTSFKKQIGSRKQVSWKSAIISSGPRGGAQGGIDLIQFHLICQKLVKFSGVEFERTVSKFTKRKCLCCVHLFHKAGAGN